MASTAAAAKAPAEAAAAAPPKKSKLLIIIVLVVVLLAGGGAAAWFFMSKGTGDEDEEVKVDDKPPVFLTIDQFTVNLQPEDGQQFLQVAMTLKVADAGVGEAIKARMPEVRSRVLLLLSSRKPSQLLSPGGKLKLAEDIGQEVEASLPQDKARSRKKAKQEDDEEDEKASKKNKGKKAKKAKPKEEEEEVQPPSRVQAVYFTHFIVQ